jgi:hypothetical protein
MNEGLPKFSGDELLAKIAELSRGLTYISESDAEVIPFAAGRSASVTVDSFVDAENIKPSVQEISVDDFFSRLTRIQDWFGPAETRTAKRFGRLQNLLVNNLRDLKAFRAGKIQIDIYVVGLDQGNNLIGIKTKAVET